jgi:hypothetical protein
VTTALLGVCTVLCTATTPGSRDLEHLSPRPTTVQIVDMMVQTKSDETTRRENDDEEDEERARRRQATPRRTHERRTVWTCGLQFRDDAVQGHRSNQEARCRR